MKTRSQKIDKFVSLAKADERRLGEATGRLSSKLSAEIERLAELNAHRRAYASKTQSMSNINSAHWKDYQDFMLRLENAARSQQQVIRECEQQLQTQRRHWLAKRQRLESLERVLENCRRDEALIESRRQQRALDEIMPNTSFYSGKTTD